MSCEKRNILRGFRQELVNAFELRKPTAFYQLPVVDFERHFNMPGAVSKWGQRTAGQPENWDPRGASLETKLFYQSRNPGRTSNRYPNLS